MIVRVYWKVQGSNAACRVFVGANSRALFKFAGNLLLDHASFLALAKGNFTPEFYEDTPQSPDAA
jgi:hypothetical protein